MSAIMAGVNAILGVTFDLLLFPFRGLHPMVGLTVVSAIAAVLMLLGYRATSNQAAVETVKRKIAAGLFEIRLFNDDLRAILRAQTSILRHNLEYMRLNLVPMFWMLVPFVLVVAQLQFHYGYRGLEVGEATLLKVRMATAAPVGAVRPAVELDLPAGLRLDADPVWIPTRGEMAWRVVAETPGSYDVTLTVGSETLTKRVQVSDAVVQRAPDRLAPGFVNQLLYPAEPPLPADSGVASISVLYPEREVGLAGFETHWLIVFLILSVAIAFALKGRFGVTI